MHLFRRLAERDGKAADRLPEHPLAVAVGGVGAHGRGDLAAQPGQHRGQGLLGAGDRQLAQRAGGGDVVGEALVAAGIEVAAVHL